MTESKAPRTFKEWVVAFLENDEEEAQQYAQLLREREQEAEFIGSHHRHAENEDTGYYDELELDIDESVLEALIIVALAATLLILVYIRQQRNRQRETGANNQPQQQPGVNQNANANINGNDRGLFPRPDQPEFAQWVAGGVGH